jgi:hypothetical protein
MKALHKGEGSIGKRVLEGKGTKEDFARLVEYYGSLPLNEPEQGDPAAWKKRTIAVLETAKALQAGREGALNSYRKAVDCKSCHSVYRPN